MGKLVFITGGVRSGKSAFAEQYVNELATKTFQTPIYMATGVAFDAEMQDRIARHQQDRAQTNLPWQTIEAPNGIELYAKTWHKEHIVLFECVTTWLSNVFYESENLSIHAKKHTIQQKLKDFKQTVISWHKQGATVLFISNEVLDDGLSRYYDTALYQQSLGELHQWLVKICDEAFEVNAQIIERWK